MKRAVQFNYWLLALLAVLCLLGTLVTGMTAGYALAFPENIFNDVTIRTLQPLHTSFALIWIFFGAQAFAGLYLAEDSRRSLVISRLVVFFQAGFLAGVVLTAARGDFSGREYLTWPVAISWPLAAGLVCTVCDIAARFGKLREHSPEAAWFLLLGFVLMPAGLIENQLYLQDRLALNPGRDLTVQWHSLDMVIAAWSLMLYATGMLILPAPGKRMRTGWLFALAAIGILLDFGHHNYPSPQAHAIKLISFTATMLAAVSFLRHVRAYRKQNELDGYRVFLRVIEGWTLFAVGTGILMAIPWVNFYVHGTYFIVGHTMGSIIGVNTLLVFAGLYHLAGGEPGWRKKLLAGLNHSLILFVVVFCALGLAKGVLRVDHDFLQWIAWVRPYYIAIPIAAVPLTLVLTMFSIDLAKNCIDRLGVMK